MSFYWYSVLLFDHLVYSMAEQISLILWPQVNESNKMGITQLLFLIGHLWMWCIVRCGSKNRHKARIMWTTCSKFVNHSRLNSEHYLLIYLFWGGVDIYDHLMNSRVFTSVMNEIFIWAPEIMRKMATDTIWNWQSSRTNCVFFTACSSLRVLHFGNEWDIHMSSRKYEENGYGHNLELAIISH